MQNTLLELNSKPKFDELKAGDIKPALENVINQARKSIISVKAFEHPTWDNSIEELTSTLEKVGLVWGVVSHINSVLDNPEWRDAYNESIPVVTSFFTEVSQDLGLLAIVKKIQSSPEYDKLTPAQRKKIENDLLSFRLSGAELKEEDRHKFSELETESATLSSQFSQNVLDSTDSFSLYFDDKSELEGILESDLSLFSNTAKANGKEGYQINLQFPYYIAVMKFAKNRALREKLYYAYITRASDLIEEKKWNNGPVIDRILTVVREQAVLLGFNNVAELSLETKMADSTEKVISFLEDIVYKAKPFALQEMEELKTFAQNDYGIEKIEAWDMVFLSEKLREKKYYFSETEVKSYFPVDKVLEGLFNLIYSLYGISFEEEKRSIWHPDVKFYSLKQHDETLGGVYVDFYARQGKRGGAWMNSYIGRRKLKDHIQLPIAYLICNFSPILDGSSYLTHQEIITLFHEMGHCLHHLLTKVDELDVSGISGVEWDAVELPSQFMENFAWEYDVLKSMSMHETTGEVFPKILFDKMYQAKNFQIGLFLLRQMEFALFDIKLFSETQQSVDWGALLSDIRKQVSVTPQVPYNRFAHAFEHIFAGGYQAGYYSYIWAEVLSADVYEAFLENPDRSAVGKKFLEEFLSQGGSRKALESFKAFRGREPKVDSMLKHLGLV